MIAWFARNHVAANLLMITIIFAGLFALNFRIPLEIFPNIESNRVNVNVSLRGSSPEEAEQSIAIRIEEAINDLEGIEDFSSSSFEGGASVTIVSADGYDARELLNDVKNRVDAISTFPSDIERPIVELAVRLRNVITVSLSGDLSEKEIRENIHSVYEDIIQLPGVTQAEILGVRDPEIAIEVDQDRLREYGLTVSQINNAISGSSIDLSAGDLKTDGGDVLIRTKGQAYEKNEFENIVLKTSIDGTLIRLGDVAKVNDGFEETDITYSLNGKNGATVQVYRVGQQSAIKIADTVKDYVTQKQASLPEGVEIIYWDDNSQIIKSRIRTLTSSAIQGGLLVFLLLSLFLRPAVAFWVFIGIPVSFLGSLLMMPLLDVSLNLITLFAFIVALGIVVDDAIVTGENIYTHMRKTESGLDAAINGTKEVAVPVTFGVLTTVAAFSAIGFVEGRLGAIFSQIPAVVIPILLFSLIESKFVLPAHLKNLKIIKDKNRKTNAFQRFQENFADGFERIILMYFQPLLKRCIQAKFSTFIIFWGLLLIVLGSIFSGRIGWTFWPRVPSETVVANITMPVGTPFSVTNSHINRMTEAAQEIKDKYTNKDTGDSAIMHILSRVGLGSNRSNEGKVLFELVPPQDRVIDVNSQDILKEWRKLIGTIPGAEQITFRAEIGRASDPFDIELRSNDLSQMEVVSELVKDRMASHPAIFDINDSLSRGRTEVRLELKPEAHLMGITKADITQQVRQSFFGLETQRIQRGRDDVRVIIRLPIEKRTSLSDLSSILINTTEGGQIPLSTLAILSPNTSPTSIRRIDGYRTLNINADLDKKSGDVTAITKDLRAHLEEISTQFPNVQYKFSGESEEQEKSFTSLLVGLMGVFFIIYCLLAIPFKSYSQPTVVMSIIPFGLIGAVIGHVLLGMNLTMMSMLGLLALVGVTVNDSLVLVDYINKRREEGADVYDAIINAGAARFRPVMLTSLTTFIGLIPLLFEKATQAQFLKPMAVSLGFGIMFATFSTLILVPVHYILLHRLKEVSRKKLIQTKQYIFS